MTSCTSLTSFKTALQMVQNQNVRVKKQQQQQQQKCNFLFSDFSCVYACKHTFPCYYDLIHTPFLLFIMIVGWPWFISCSYKCLVDFNCFRNRLSDRHSCLNLCPCVKKFRQYLYLCVHFCACIHVRVRECLRAPQCVRICTHDIMCVYVRMCVPGRAHIFISPFTLPQNVTWRHWRGTSHLLIWRHWRGVSHLLNWRHWRGASHLLIWRHWQGASHLLN